MKSGYASEQDLFVTRLCFEVLIRNQKDKTGIQQVSQIKQAFPEMKSLLFNFVDILIDTIEVQDCTLLKQYCGVYKSQLERDGQFINYVDRIAKYYFNGETIIKANPMQQMLQNMMKGGANPMANMLGGGKK